MEVEPPTVEKRLDRIENQIDVEIPKRIAAAEREAVEQAQKRMEEHVRFMIDGVRGDLGQVTNLLTGSLGGASRALRGVAALVVGLALQMIGSVVSTILQ